MTPLARHVPTYPFHGLHFLSDLFGQSNQNLFRRRAIDLERRCFHLKHLGEKTLRSKARATHLQLLVHLHSHPCHHFLLLPVPQPLRARYISDRRILRAFLRQCPSNARSMHSPATSPAERQPVREHLPRHISGW